MFPSNLLKGPFSNNPRKNRSRVKARQDEIQPRPSPVCYISCPSHPNPSNHLSRVHRIFRLVRISRDDATVQPVDSKTCVTSSEPPLFSNSSHSYLLDLSHPPRIKKEKRQTQTNHPTPHPVPTSSPSSPTAPPAPMAPYSATPPKASPTTATPTSPS